jgi:hypothetical protein
MERVFQEGRSEYPEIEVMKMKQEVKELANQLQLVQSENVQVSQQLKPSRHKSQRKHEEPPSLSKQDAITALSELLKSRAAFARSQRRQKTS